MNNHTNWWEPIFAGELEVGLNKDKLEDIEQETFLYFNEANFEMESNA
ncbi:hypothetical protein QWY14_06555 [Planococcus sp. N028]|uniref:Uncharacterized protein n=1 Tax=Planococcus shixiaomingii TaxID=3058393 RepID=A0ABT8N0M6_9BACL|nr:MULTISPECIES: hypothetical protein [unclassified Planococcus (in: firmicutes)]MDN7241446.1 hypothetical protein [Planococcus sp. N028]WKA53700.1 hypothetical protein QWY21_13630 [Planococcus sp. N022]